MIVRFDFSKAIRLIKGVLDGFCPQIICLTNTLRLNFFLINKGFVTLDFISGDLQEWSREITKAEATNLVNCILDFIKSRQPVTGHIADIGFHIFEKHGWLMITFSGRFGTLFEKYSTAGEYESVLLSSERCLAHLTAEHPEQLNG